MPSQMYGERPDDSDGKLTNREINKFGRQIIVPEIGMKGKCLIHWVSYVCHIHFHLSDQYILDFIQFGNYSEELRLLTGIH